MSTNRIVRIAVGLVLIGYGVYSGNAWFYLGVLPLLTGIINWCPLEMKMGTCDPASGCCATPINDATAESCCSVPESVAPKAAPSSAPKPTNLAWSANKTVKIEILGIGCKKCKELEAMAREAVKDLDGDYEIIKVEDIQDIANYGVTSTPALVVDGVVKSTGRVLKPQEIKQLLA